LPVRLGISTGKPFDFAATPVARWANVGACVRA